MVIVPTFQFKPVLRLIRREDKVLIFTRIQVSRFCLEISLDLQINQKIFELLRTLWVSNHLNWKEGGTRDYEIELIGIHTVNSLSALTLRFPLILIGVNLGDRKEDFKSYRELCECGERGHNIKCKVRIRVSHFTSSGFETGFLGKTTRI